MCILTASAAAGAEEGIAREVVDARCLYPRSFETRPFTAEVFGAFVGFVYAGVRPIDNGIVVEVGKLKVWTIFLATDPKIRKHNRGVTSLYNMRDLILVNYLTWL